MLRPTHYIDRYEPAAPGRGGPSASPSRYESRHASSSRQNSRYAPYSARVDDTPAPRWKTAPDHDSGRPIKRYYNEDRDYEYRRYPSSTHRRERSVSQAREDGLKAVLQTRRRSTTPSSTFHDQSNNDAHPVSLPLVNRIESTIFPSQICKADSHLPSASQNLPIRISGLSASQGIRYIPFPENHDSHVDSAARDGDTETVYREGGDIQEEHRTDEERPVLSKQQLGEILKNIFERGNAAASNVTQEAGEERNKITVEDEKEEGEESEKSENASQDTSKEQSLQARLSPSSISLAERLSPLYSPSSMSLDSLSPSSAEQLQDRLSGPGTPAKNDTMNITPPVTDTGKRRDPQDSRATEAKDEDDDVLSFQDSPAIHRRYESQEMSFSSSTDSNESFRRSPPSLYDRLSYSPEHSLQSRSFFPIRQKKYNNDERTTHTPDWIKEYEVVLPSGTILCDRRKAAYAPPSTFRTTSSYSHSQEEYEREEKVDRKYGTRNWERQREVDRGTRTDYWRDTAAIVGNMVAGVTTGDVKAIFSEFGEIVHVSLIPCPWQDLLQEDIDKQTSSTSALIIYADSSSCKRASEEMDGVMADEQPLRVEYIRRNDYPGRWPYSAWRRD